MRDSGSWNGRRIVIIVIFALTVIYGLHDLLGSKPESRVAPGAIAKSEELRVAAIPSTSPGNITGEQRVSSPQPEPPVDVLAEAELWRTEGWDGADPFSGQRWPEGPAVEMGAPVCSGADTLLRATSRSSSGWQAVVGEQVLQIGDTIFGGRVVSISRDKVIVRGANWEKVLRFPEERGY